MTQLLTDVGQMAFNSIGFHANLILNRLRNQTLVGDVEAEQEQARRRQEAKEEAARTKLELVKRRLRDLAAFERRARGEKD